MPLHARVFAGLVALLELVAGVRLRFDATPGTPLHDRLHATRAVLHVLQQLVLMVQTWGSEESARLAEEAFRFGKGSAVAPPPAAGEAASVQPPPAAPRAYERRTAPHLRALGIKFHPMVHELGEASLAEMVTWLFPESDPIFGILQSIARDTALISSALRDDQADCTQQIDMALCAIGSRADVCAELYMRVLKSMRDGNAPASKAVSS